MTEYKVGRSKRTRAPSHPGGVLKHIVLPDLNMSVTEAARRLGVSRKHLHAILNETAGVTPEMAIRIDKFCGNDPDIWANMQVAYDLWRAKRDVDLSKVEAAA